MKNSFSISLLVALTFGVFGCDSSHVARVDRGIEDGAVSGDGSTDSLFADSYQSDGAIADARGPDGRGDGPIEILPDGMSGSVSATTGGLVSKGGVYTLKSILGPGININPIVGGPYTLRRNGSILSW